jgi:hypothetical protein
VASERAAPAGRIEPMRCPTTPHATYGVQQQQCGRSQSRGRHRRGSPVAAPQEPSDNHGSVSSLATGRTKEEEEEEEAPTTDVAHHMMQSSKFDESEPPKKRARSNTVHSTPGRLEWNSTCTLDVGQQNCFIGTSYRRHA